MIRSLMTMLLTVSSITIFSQASLEITVTGPDEEPLAGIAVRIENQSIGYAAERLSDENGRVRLDGLSTSGRYKVTAGTGSFYEQKTIANLLLISDRTTSVLLKLSEEVAELEEVYVVSDTYQAINTVNAEVSSEMRRKEIEELPVEGRDITRVLYRLPNITQATGFFPEAPNVAINGANSLYTNYQIDGLDNNENFLGGQRFSVPVGFTKNITALTNNFSAEHGLTSNGIINITSRSGTNDLFAEAFYFVRPGPPLDASSPFAQRDLSGNQVKDGFQRHQVGGAVGGAIVRDKTFYFVNIEHTTDLKDNLLNSPELNVNETVPGTNHFTYLSAKLDHRWSSRFRTSLRVNAGIVNIDRQGGGLEGGVTFPSAGNQQDRNSLNVALKNILTTETLTYEANYQYGRFRWNYAEPENPDFPNVSVLDPSEQTIAVIGHPGFVFDETEQTHVLQQKLTLYKGQHTIKTGMQLRSSGFELFGGGNPNGSYTLKLTQDELDALQAQNPGSELDPFDIPETAEVLNYGVELRPSAFRKRQNILSLYIEDQLAISADWNVNIGLRYDYDNLTKGGGSQGDFNNIAPRLSIAHKLNEFSSIRFGYGIYYDKILYAVYSDALQFSSDSEDFRAQVNALIAEGILPTSTDLDRVTNEGNITANIGNVTYLQGPSSDELQDRRNDLFSNELRILNPNGFDNPYSHQIMAGYQRKLDDHTLFYVDVMHNRSYNLYRLRDLNAPEPYAIDETNVVVRSQEEADATRPVPILYDAEGPYALIDGQVRRGIARNLVVTETSGRSNYYAANFTFQNERGSDRFAYRLMYTLSYLENNTEDINFRAMDANDFGSEWGPSINDRRHLINGILTYYPANRWTFTLAALIQSGQPVNRIPDATLYGTTDLNGDGRSFGDAYVGNSDRSPGESRNSDRLPWSETFDLSLFYRLPFGDKHSMEIGAYVFNVFNAENLSGYANNATQSNQIQAEPAGSGIIRRNSAPPRQFQFSLRYQIR